MLIVLKIFSTPQYEFLNPKATQSLAHCTEAAQDLGDECYYIPHLNYFETVTWHQNKLSTLGCEGGSSTDDVPFSFFYQKDDKKIQLIFYPANTTIEGNITTIHYDKAGVGLLIKNVNLSD